MIASTCSRVRPVRRAIGFATDLATRPRIPVRDAVPISTALSCAFMSNGFPEQGHLKRAACDVRPRCIREAWSSPERPASALPIVLEHARSAATSRN